MPQIPRLPILVPLAVGLGAFVATIFVHALALRATVVFVRRQKELGRLGAGFWIDGLIVAL